MLSSSKEWGFCIYCEAVLSPGWLRGLRVESPESSTLASNVVPRFSGDGWQVAKRSLSCLKASIMERTISCAAGASVARFVHSFAHLRDGVRRALAKKKGQARSCVPAQANG
jgi:hypothetical protein